MPTSAPTSLRKSHTLRIPYVKYSTGANNATRIACRALGKPDPTAARRAFRRRKQNDNTYNETKSFSGATAPFASPAPLFSPFFSGKTEKNGPPETHCAIPAQLKHAAGGVPRCSGTEKNGPAEQSPRHSGAEKTSAEAEEIGREGQNLHNLQKSTLDNDRKIRMIILSHNRSTGRRGKNRPV